MKLTHHPALDALAAHYVLGTLRGPARARFARALREEPAVSARVDYWLSRANLRPSTTQAVQPSAAVWKRLERDLKLAQFRAPWFARISVWRNWAIAATTAAAVLVAFNLTTLTPTSEPVQAMRVIASLASDGAPTKVEARLSEDGRMLMLKADRAVLANREQSYELWLLPASGTAPISLAVVGSLDAHFALPATQVGQLNRGAKLAISVEPAGGSRTGAPTGPVILVGAINS